MTSAVPTTLRKTICNFFTWFGIIIVVFVGCLLLASSFRIPYVELEAFSVLSGSMEPTIGTGSMIFVRPKPFYEVGDIITVKSSTSDINVTHRVIAVTETPQGREYTTKGDANDVEDKEFAKQENIIGNVRFSVPFLGYLATFAKSPLGFVLIIVVPATIIVWEESKTIYKELSAKLGASGKSNQSNKSERSRQAEQAEQTRQIKKETTKSSDPLPPQT